MLHIMGLLSYAVTPHEALSEISPTYRAAVILLPGILPDAQAFTEKLRSYVKSIPLYAISDNQDKYGIFNAVFDKKTSAPILAGQIANLQRRAGIEVIGDYRIAGIDAVPSGGSVKYFDRPLPFTKTESMILRYLICTYPLPQTPKNILKHAFRPSRIPEESSIRTHISVMNKKFKSIANRNLIIHYQDKGYILLTPEIMSKNDFM